MVVRLREREIFAGFARSVGQVRRRRREDPVVETAAGDGDHRSVGAVVVGGLLGAQAGGEAQEYEAGKRGE